MRRQTKIQKPGRRSQSQKKRRVFDDNFDFLIATDMFDDTPPIEGGGGGGKFVPDETFDTQYPYPEYREYKDWCRSQTPYVCGKRTNNPGRCRRKERDCLVSKTRVPGPSGGDNYIYQDLDDDYLYGFMDPKDRIGLMPTLGKKGSVDDNSKREFEKSLRKDQRLVPDKNQIKTEYLKRMEDHRDVGYQPLGGIDREQNLEKRLKRSAELREFIRKGRINNEIDKMNQRLNALDGRRKRKSRRKSKKSRRKSKKSSKSRRRKH